MKKPFTFLKQIGVRPLADRGGKSDTKTRIRGSLTRLAESAGHSSKKPGASLFGVARSASTRLSRLIPSGSDAPPQASPRFHGLAEKARAVVGTASSTLRRDAGQAEAAAGRKFSKNALDVGAGAWTQVKTHADRLRRERPFLRRRTAERIQQVSVWLAKPELTKQVARIPERSRWLSRSVAEGLSAVLATDAARNIDGWMRDAIASGKATVYDKAMDAQHIADGAYGGLHRLYDGGHDIAGAFTAVRNALPDDSIGQEIAGGLRSILKDVVTPMGLPFATLDMASFEKAAQVIGDYTGASRQWVADAASFTATEILSASVTGVAVALNWTKGDTRRFAAMVASTGISSMVGGNPVLAIPVVVGMARLYQKAGRGDFTELLEGAGKGSTGTLAFLAVAEAVSGGPWLQLTAGLAAAISSGKGYDAVLDWLRTRTPPALEAPQPAADPA